MAVKSPISLLLVILLLRPLPLPAESNIENALSAAVNDNVAMERVQITFEEGREQLDGATRLTLLGDGTVTVVTTRRGRSQSVESQVTAGTLERLLTAMREDRFWSVTPTGSRRVRDESVLRITLDIPGESPAKAQLVIGENEARTREELRTTILLLREIARQSAVQSAP